MISSAILLMFCVVTMALRRAGRIVDRPGPGVSNSCSCELGEVPSRRLRNSLEKVPVCAMSQSNQETAPSNIPWLSRHLGSDHAVFTTVTLS
jgi:hypothetical protein